jgi:hypothetical protein
MRREALRDRGRSLQLHRSRVANTGEILCTISHLLPLHFAPVFAGPFVSVAANHMQSVDE